MTTPTLIDAARAALDALGNLIDAQNGPPLVAQADEWDCAMYEANAAIDALRAAISAVETAQPVAWVLTEELDARRTTSNAHLLFSDQEIFAWTPWTPVWTHPPEPARQPMTEREIIGGFEVLPEALTFFTAFEAGVRHAERNHRIGSEETTR